MMRAETRSAVRVLVIDDSVVARTSMVELLASGGYLVHSLPSAIGATRLIYQHGINVVVVDLGMPGLSGDKLIDLLRKNPKFNHLILIVVSGESDAELDRLRKTGAVDAALPKRDVHHRLLPEVLRLLNGGDQEAATNSSGDRLSPNVSIRNTGSR